MTVRIEDLKVGMKVKLVNKKPKGVLHCGFNNQMEKYLGKVCIVKEVVIWATKGIVIKEDKNRFIWDVRLIEKIVDDKEKKNKVYTSLNEIRKEISFEDYTGLLDNYFLTSSIFKFDKCIVNNNCVIGIFIDIVDKRIYKGIAKCHPNDKFDLAKGLTIAMLRAYNEYLKRKIKKLY